jgi:hypothetical protein
LIDDELRTATPEDGAPEERPQPGSEAPLAAVLRKPEPPEPIKPAPGIQDLRQAILEGLGMADEGGIPGWLDRLAREKPRLARQARNLKRRFEAMEGDKRNGRSHRKT